MAAKLIIFDLDGTLVDAYMAVARSLNFALKKAGLPRQRDSIIRRRVGWGDRNLVQAFVPSSRVDETLAVYRSHHALSLKGGTRFLPGAKKTLAALKNEGCLLAVASNRPTVFTHIILEHLKILEWFDIVLCADKVRHPKPAPDILKKILRRLRISAAGAVYVGDMTIDVEAGRRAGIKTIAVVTGSSSREEILKQKPFAVIRRMDQLHAALGL